jgi:hypothetical protein
MAMTWRQRVGSVWQRPLARARRTWFQSIMMRSAAIDDRRPERWPLLRSSWIFALLFGCWILLAATGGLIWFAGRTGRQFEHYGLAVWHVNAAWFMSALFVFVAMSHIRGAFGPWRMWWFALVYVGGVLLFMLIHMPILEVFLALQAVVYLALRLFLSRPAAAADARAAGSGAFAASMWWLFLFLTGGFYFAEEQFYLRFPLMHLVLAAAAFAALAFHIFRVRARPAPAGPPFWRRAALVGLLGAGVLAAAGNEAAGAKRLFVRRAAPAEITYQAIYDTSAIRAGRPLAPNPAPLFVDSRSCRGAACHDDIYRQWSISSHRYASVIQPYRKMIRLVYDELGPEQTLFCSKCHTPLLAMLGLPDAPDDRSLDKYRNAGITCQYCHSIRRAGATLGNGDFRLAFEKNQFQDYDALGEAGRTATRDFIRHNLSRHREVYPGRHVKVLPLPEPETNEYCVGCHRVVMPPELVGGRKLILGDVHTTFLESMPRGQKVSCSDCHMDLATYWGRRYHARPDHRMLGTNNAMTLMVRAPYDIEPNLGELDAVTEQYLRGTYTVPLYEVLYLSLIGNRKYEAYVQFLKGNTKIDVELSAPQTAVAGSTAAVKVLVANTTAAHVMPSGPIDLNEYWLEIGAVAADGRRIFESGAVGPDHALQDGAVVFGGVPLDKDGRAVEHHRFWNSYSIKDRLVIPLDGVVSHTYDIPIPPDAAGPIAITASFCYRRYNQRVADWLYDGDGTTFPIYRYSTATASMAVVRP